MQRTEPMNIGSPNSPPTGGNRQQNSFLPPFLMGDASYSTPVTPPSKPWCLPTSPGRSSVNHSTTNPNSTSFANNFRNEQLPRDDMSKSPSRRKIGAPPVKGLFESFPPSCGNLPYKMDNGGIDSSMGGRSFCMTPGRDDPSPACFNMTSGADSVMGDKMRHAGSMLQTSSTPFLQHDSYYQSGDPTGADADTEDNAWVTIYGFPPATESYILQEFSTFGTILKHLVPAEGNWLHVQFQNKIQARKALSKHGKILSGNIMIGVKKCEEKGVTENKENAGGMKATFMNSPARSATLNINSPCGPPYRPVNSYADQTKAIDPSTGQQQNSGFVSKAVGYMFGW